MKCTFDEKDKQPGAYISNIYFNDGQSLTGLKKNDIVIFVGPNNAGKSQAMKDLYYLLSTESAVVIKDIDIRKSKISYEELVRNNGNPVDKNESVFKVMGTVVPVSSQNIDYYLSHTDRLASYLGELYGCYLTTENRLTICKPPQLINKTEARTHPIHYIAFDKESRKKLTKYFLEAFDYYVYPNIQYGNTIPLVMAKEKIDLNGQKFSDETERAEAYADELSKNPQIQDQGDGIKSFVGILLYLILDFYRIYFIDEPESFLHPPQAEILGRMMGEISGKEKQIFIATHSQSLIRGLLEAVPERVKLVRITRDGDSNHICILNSEDLQKIWNDPILKYSNIMEGLFYKEVVVCESDSDCRFYSIINDALKKEEGKYGETLFIPVNGKQRLGVVVNALKSIGVDVKVITDFDILRSKEIFRKLCLSCGIEWEMIGEVYNKFYDAVNQEPSQGPEKKDVVLSHIQSIFNRNKSNDYLNESEKGKIIQLLKQKDAWSNLKNSGENGLPPGEASAAYKEIKATIKEGGLFIVPVGELECFVKEVRGHGPKWVDDVLQKYPDFRNPVYEKAGEFIKEMNL